MVELTIPLETGAENTGAMKQIRNTELVDSIKVYKKNKLMKKKLN